LAVASNVFGAVFTKLGATELTTNALLPLPLPDTGKLLLIMALIFVLGWPLEWPPIIADSVCSLSLVGEAGDIRSLSPWADLYP
jgi:TRAP-type mannitol/chloroaromatic compound transport system permease large subunit